jgi:Fur family transcriptional regulator, ferric uptake regulator
VKLESVGYYWELFPVSQPRTLPMSHPPTRDTRQRRVMLEELRGLTSHPTAAELHEITRRRLPRIGLGTVYRNLELLSREGMIGKLESGSAEARYDGNSEPHHHLHCLHCGRIDDARVPLAEPVRPVDDDFEGYEILGHRLEFFGICPKCREQAATERS